MQGNAKVVDTQGQWHKLLLMVMLKYGYSEVEITEEDVALIEQEDMAILSDYRGGRLVIRALKSSEATQLLESCNGVSH